MEDGPHPSQAAEEPSPELGRATTALFLRREVQLWTLAFVIVGIAIGFVLFPTEWSVFRKFAGGVLLGVGSVFCLLLPRMIGGRDYN